MQRDKGLLGEREVNHVFAAFGWTMRGLEGMGDHVAMRPRSLDRSPGFNILHVEVKRQERLLLPKWIAQAEAEAPPGTIPVVVYRRSREPWRIDMDLAQFLKVVG